MSTAAKLYVPERESAALDSPMLGTAAKTYSTLPDTVFLRSADCLHLVTDLHHNFSEIHTHDTHQALAAAALGMRALVIEP